MEEVEDIQVLENYEMMLIFLSDLGEDRISKEFSEVKTDITEAGGEILNEDIWSNRELSYRIKKQDKGFYIVLNFKLGTEKIAEIQKSLNLNPNVVRYLLVKTPVNYSFKTLEQYNVEAEKVAKEKEEKKKAVEKPKPRKPEVKTKPETVEKPKVTKEPKKVEKKPEKLNLDDVDEKLKSIINNPDINL